MILSCVTCAVDFPLGDDAVEELAGSVCPVCGNKLVVVNKPVVKKTRKIVGATAVNYKPKP